MSWKTYTLDSVGVLHGKFRIVRSLDCFIDDAVDDTQGLKVKSDTILFTRFDLLVLLVEVVEELSISTLHLFTGKLKKLTAGP